MEYIEAGINGDLCPVGDTDRLATAVERILNGDDGMRQRLRQACVKTAEKYDADNVADKMHSFLESLFNRRDCLQPTTRSKDAAAP